MTRHATDASIIKSHLDAISCEYTAKEDPWQYQKEYYAKRYHEDEAFRSKESKHSKDDIMRKYHNDPAFREKKKAAERERYQKKKALKIASQTPNESL